MAGEQRLFQHRADLLRGVVNLGQIGRLHRRCVEPPVARQSGGQHPVHCRSISVGLLRLRHRIAEELAVHRVSDARCRVVRLFEMHAGVRSESVNSPIDEDVRRRDVVDFLIERIGPVHDRMRRVQVGAEHRLWPRRFEIAPSLSLAFLYDLAADRHVLEPVVIGSRGGVVGELPAALLVPRLLVPIGKSAGRSTGGSLAPTQARLVERPDADDVRREPSQSLRRVKAQQPHRIVHLRRGPALHRAEWFVSHIASPIHVDDRRQVRSDRILEDFHAGRLHAARRKIRSRLLLIEPPITEGIAEEEICSSRLQLVEVRRLRHEHRRVNHAAADRQLADLFVIELHGIHIRCERAEGQLDRRRPCLAVYLERQRRDARARRHKLDLGLRIRRQSGHGDLNRLVRVKRLPLLRKQQLRSR